MIAQNEPRFREEIREYGCYYFSLLWWGWRAGRQTYTPSDINDYLFNFFIDKGWMANEEGRRCYILDPVSILRSLHVLVSRVRKEEGLYFPAYSDILVGQWKAPGSISHFVPMYTGSQGVAFDPWWGGSKAVRDGKLLSWRVFS